MRRVPPALLPRHVNAITVLCRSQGRLYVGQRGAEKPGGDSVQRGPEDAAVDGAPEHQRGGPDEADADQQEHGTAPAAGHIHGSLSTDLWIPDRLQPLQTCACFYRRFVTSLWSLQSWSGTSSETKAP